MNFFKVCQFIFILVVLAVMGRSEKADSERARRVFYWTFVCSIGIVTPFACIETLSAFGIRLFDVNWSFTPLNIMSSMCMSYLIVLSGKKLFGIIDTAK